MISEIFGTHLFSETEMKKRLTAAQFAEVSRVGKLSMETADAVADAMKAWALEKGATHYSHWFQPMTGNTAEKHESFLAGTKDGKPLLKLTGKQLIMGESDASSFPTGGLRETAYARGYTAWDRTSPVFLKEEAAGMILCIPTIFVSYTGEALDTKTPLLRSMDALNRQALRIVRLFGSDDVTKVTPQVGPEQEYFLIDRERYLKRRDLLYCGRTLFGAPAPKGQELDDQYFGIIRERQGAFMQELNAQLWKLGVPATTQHNEVAPAQHEMAPIFCAANIAVDQNQLIMETMKQVAGRHGLVCLLHEKPFAGVNGSGKHNNWSMSCDNGENLLDPGQDPKSNLRFQLILSCILKAVDRHADLLRLTAGNPGNDLRLGGQEAPPAIVSVFLGDQLNEMVQCILAGAPTADPESVTLDTGASAVPVLKKDAADRNRTSPFAFTGNKFEFRMVGSSDTIATANTTLNTIVAEALCEAADTLELAENFEEACAKLIRQNLESHQRILFHGNSYSPEWAEEAARRGLPNLPSMVDAIPALLTDKAVGMYEKFHVFTRSELESRTEILYETYSKHINIEAQTMLHMVAKHYIPVAIRFSRELAASVNEIRAACPNLEPGVQLDLLQQVYTLLEQTSRLHKQLQLQVKQTRELPSATEMANSFHDQVVPVMEHLRSAVDGLELLVSKDIWPVPTYGDLLFEV